MSQTAPTIKMTYASPGRFSFDPASPQPAKNQAKTYYRVERTDGSPCKIRSITFENPNNPSQTCSFTSASNDDNGGNGGSFTWKGDKGEVKVTAIRVNSSNTKFCLDDELTDDSQGVVSFTIGVEDQGTGHNGQTFTSADPQITIKGSHCPSARLRAHCNTWPGTTIPVPSSDP